MTAPDPLHRRHLLALLASLCVPACSSTAPPTDDDRDFMRLRQARYVLLGEVHDNAEQQGVRAALLARLLSDGRSSCVVFEQMDAGHDAAIAAAPRDPESVASAGELDRKGWGWPLHRPVIEAALAAGAAIRGGDLSNADARAIVRAGAASIPGGSARLLDAATWSPVDESQVERDIAEGHCGALPPDLVPKMALAQRARDATLADALLQAGALYRRVVLVAGNGHTRTDLGVTRYLVAAGVARGEIVAVGYLEQADASAPYDLVRVTSRQERTDPCLAFRNRP